MIKELRADTIEHDRLCLILWKKKEKQKADLLPDNIDRMVKLPVDWWIQQNWWTRNRILKSDYREVNPSVIKAQTHKSGLSSLMYQFCSNEVQPGIQKEIWTAREGH
jgi:hypothetical protein